MRIFLIYPEKLTLNAPLSGAPSVPMIIQGLIRAGHDVHYLGLTEPECDSMIPEYRGLYIHWNRFSFRPAYSDFLQVPQKASFWTRQKFRMLRYLTWLFLNWEAALNIRQIFSKIKPDLIYLATPLLGPVAAYIKTLYPRIPVVMRILGVQNAYLYIKDPFLPMRQLMLYVSFKAGCDGYIITDDGTRGDMVARRFGIPDDNICCWTNGIPDVIFEGKDNRAESLDGKLTILSTSRLDSQKHVERIVEAMPNILEEIPQAVLVIIGGGPERSRLEADVRRLGLGKHVRFLGRIVWEDVVPYYQTCDVFVAVADQSNLGNITYEAMACGCCVLALDVGGTSRVIRHGENGYLITKERLDSLAEEVRTLLKDKALRQRLGRGAGQFAEQTLERRSVRVAKEINFLESLAGG